MTNIPGANVLKTALSVIGKQMFFYYRFNTRSLNAIGQDIAVYFPPARHKGSIQPVPRELMREYGLDFQNHYITVFVPLETFDISRDISGDQIMYKGQIYQCLSKTPWFHQDGWGSILCVQIPNQPMLESITPPPPGTYGVNAILIFKAEFNLPVNVTGTPQLDLLIGGVPQVAPYQSGTQVMLFSYTVQAGDSGPITLAVTPPATTPSIDLTNGAIAGTGVGTPGANVNFTMPLLTGVTANA